MTPKKILKMAAGWCIAAFFIWQILRRVDVDALLNVLGKATLSWLVFGVGVFLFGYVCRVERWRQMLRLENSELSWLQCSGPLFAGFAANNVLPFRAGDLLRAVAFTNRLGVSAGAVVATLLVERLLDLLMVLTFLAIALKFTGATSGMVLGVGVWGLLTLAAGLMGCLVLPRAFAPLVLKLTRMASLFSPRISDRLTKEVSTGFQVLNRLAKGGMMIKLIVWSSVAWLCEGVLFWAVACSIPAITNQEASWVALPAGTLATLIPGTPGHVGTFDYFTARAMTALGNVEVASTTFAILVHVLLWAPPTIVGGLFIAFKSRTDKETEIRVDNEE